MNRIKTTVLPRAGPVVFQPSRSRDLDGQPNNGFMQQRHSREKRRGEVREDGRMERSPRRLFRSQGLHLPEGEDAGVGNYFLECVRPAADWPEPINNLPNRISHEVSSCPFPKRIMVRMNHSDSSATVERIIRVKINCKGRGRKIPKIFLSQLFPAENSCCPSSLPHRRQRGQEAQENQAWDQGNADRCATLACVVAAADNWARHAQLFARIRRGFRVRANGRGAETNRLR